MGLSASQARILLLTAKNNALELQAQKIENERLILAQQQEDISNEYSDATSNQVYKLTKSNEVLTFETLAKSSAPDGADGLAYVIANAQGQAMYRARAGADGKVSYAKYISDGAGGGSWQELSAKAAADDNTLQKYTSNGGADGAMQKGLRSGAIQIYVQDTNAPEDEAGIENYTGTLFRDDAVEGGREIFNKRIVAYLRQSPESLDGVQTKYYSEDDTEAQTKYQAAMARINILDTRLENKLNQVETQKKGVEQELESAEQLVKTNEERTFKYFS